MSLLAYCPARSHWPVGASVRRRPSPYVESSDGGSTRTSPTSSPADRAVDPSHPNPSRSIVHEAGASVANIDRRRSARQVAGTVSPGPVPRRSPPSDRRGAAGTPRAGAACRSVADLKAASARRGRDRPCSCHGLVVVVVVSFREGAGTVKYILCWPRGSRSWRRRRGESDLSPQHLAAAVIARLAKWREIVCRDADPPEPRS